ncbi:hypothetical protein ACLQ28_15415 [Micromonospora sp. DT201]|uniref:hypothetical protein n=1 Tax=Micromonospora sp. DT201 TaxID=3393442 RepID=UPI003CEBBB94
MGSADGRLHLTLRINNGLLLVRDGAGNWLIQGAADGLVYPAGDRLAWLLPLLERTPSDVNAELSDVPVADTPLPALVRFALTAWGSYWPTCWTRANFPSRFATEHFASGTSRQLPDGLTKPESRSHLDQRRTYTALHAEYSRWSR